MTGAPYGATPDAWWALAAELGLQDRLLPVVARPGVPIAPMSKLKALGKVPSEYNGDRQVRGIARWPEKRATEREIRAWSAEPDYGICVQTGRGLLAIDVDIDDRETSRKVFRCIRETIGWPEGEYGPAHRFRSNSAKFLLPVWVNGSFTKRRLVLPDGQGAVELLAEGQQFVAIGTHPSGVRYEWSSGELPDDFLALEEEELEACWLRLRDLLGAEDSRSEATKPRAEQITEAVRADATAAFLFDTGRVLSVGRDGQLFVECPNAGEHTSAANETATAYYPAHTGGFAQGHWVCLHAHCAGKPDAFFSNLLQPIVWEDLTDEQDADELGPAAAAGEDKFRPVPAAEYLRRAVATKWLIKHVLPAHGVGTVFGPSGAAKSFAVLDMLGHVATGRWWQGCRVKQGRVVYLAAEGQGGMAARIEAWCRHRGVAPEDLQLEVIDGVPNLLERQDAVALARAVGKCAVLVLDTAMAVAAGGDENSSEDMGRLMKFAALLARATGGLVLLVHHAGKDVSRGQRGWSGLKGAIDVEIEVSRLDEDGELRQLRLSKVRDGKREGDRWTFRLEDVVLGQDEDGDDIGSAVPEYVPNPTPPVRGEKLGKNEQIVKTAALDTIKQGGRASVDEVLTLAVSRMTRDPTKRDVRRTNAQHALDSLIRRDVLTLDGDWILES